MLKTVELLNIFVGNVILFCPDGLMNRGFKGIFIYNRHCLSLVCSPLDFLHTFIASLLSNSEKKKIRKNIYITNPTLLNGTVNV